MQDPNVYPPGLDAEKVQEIIAYYDSLTEEEWVAHAEYAYENPYTVDVLIPHALLPTVRELVARHEVEHPTETAASQAWLDRKSDGPGNFPPGWDSERVRRLVAEARAEEEALGPEAAEFKPDGRTLMLIPASLASAVEALLEGHRSAQTAAD